MKKIFLFLIILNTLYLILYTNAYAATPTPKETTEPTNKDLINNLKERIASRVAELKLVERKGVIGTVSDVSDTQITISDLQDNTRFIDVDELTKFSSPTSSAAKGSFGISDITKWSKIGILGLYNKQSRRILARFIDVLALPKSVHGAILNKDNENFTLTIVSKNGKKTIIDIEKITKTFSYTKDGGMQKYGFSKIKGDEHIIVIGFTDVKDKNRMIASRILIFPEIPKDPRIVSAEPAINPQETIVPSTGSGKKLTPITR